MEKYCRARQATGDNKIRHLRFAYCLPRVTDTHSEYVILTDFRLQMWLLEGASMLQYTYTACLVCFLLWHDFWGQAVSVIMFNAWVGPQLDYVRGVKLSGSRLLIYFVSRTAQIYNSCKFSQIYFMHLQFIA